MTVRLTANHASRFLAAFVTSVAAMHGIAAMSLGAPGPIAGATTSQGKVDTSPAAELLNALRHRRPIKTVIEPASAAERKRQEARAALWPEGASLLDRQGRIAVDGEWWTLVPADAADLPPIKLLPNSWLESMVRSTVSTAIAPSFVVSGEVTEYGGENYLLPRYVTRAVRPTPGASRTTEPGVASDHDVDAQLESPVGATDVATDARIDDVVDRLRRQTPTEQMLMPEFSTPSQRPAQTMHGGQGLRPDGSTLVERPGRLVQDGEWWSFVFESDRPEFPELPVRLLPNRNVELMVNASQNEMTELVFVVSGEVTVFDGANYLLTRAARRRIDPGNLRK